MADAPLSRQISAGFTRPHLRAINNEYHLELTAKNTDDIRVGQTLQTRMQAQVAAANLRAMGEIDRSINDLHSGLNDGFDAMVNEARYMSGQLENIDETLAQGFEKLDATLYAGVTVVADELTRVVAGLAKMHLTLNEIATTLSQPYETGVQELLSEGDRWLKQAELCDGREQADNRRDALRLFDEVIANKKGATNFVAWFNAGYLHWKLNADVPKAENCFYQAQRFTAPLRNLWHTKSLRYQAEMQYLGAKHEEAWNTANKGLTVQREYETIYNAARYAAKTGRKDEATALLDECIELRPTTIVTMFSEEDFLE